MDSLKTEDFILGFQDESSPQTIANTVRKWCPEKPRMIKNTNKIKANSMGFYAIRGRSVIEFPQRSKTDDMCMFLESVRRWNDDRPIVMITDNCSIHHSKKSPRNGKNPGHIPRFPSTILPATQSDRVHLEDPEEIGVQDLLSGP